MKHKVSFTPALAYVAAKHSVAGLTENAAINYATAGIRLISIGPDFIRSKTDLHQSKVRAHTHAMET